MVCGSLNRVGDSGAVVKRKVLNNLRHVNRAFGFNIFRRKGRDGRSVGKPFRLPNVGTRNHNLFDTFIFLCEKVAGESCKAEGYSSGEGINTKGGFSKQSRLIIHEPFSH